MKREQYVEFAISTASILINKYLLKTKVFWQKINREEIKLYIIKIEKRKRSVVLKLKLQLYKI